MVIETVGGRSPPTLSARQRTTQIDSRHLPVGMRLRISQSADSGSASAEVLRNQVLATSAASPVCQPSRCKF